MTDVLDGVLKEPDEVEYKGIDLATNWLEEEEDIKELYVYAYEATDNLIKEYDLSNVQYVSITTYDESHNVVHSETEWETSDSWELIKLIVQSAEEEIEVTDSLIVDETGSDDPNRWVQEIEDGKLRIGIRNGEPGKNYRVLVRFSTNTGRIKLLHFPVDIYKVRNV